MMNSLLLLCATVTNALANVLVKIGSERMKDIRGATAFVEAFVKNIYIWVGLLSFAIAFVLYAKVLTSMKLSVAYPVMTSVGFLIVSIASSILFKENFSPIKILGIVTVAAGIWLISIS